MAERQRGSRDARGSERGGASVALFRLPPPAAGGSPSRADQLILAAATGARRLSDEELREVLEHVAHAGFDPRPDRRGRTAAEKHFRKHVIEQREWPEDTTFEQYLASARMVVLDPRSSIMTSQYYREHQLAVIGPSGSMRGPKGGDWIVVEYRLGLGHWTTVFQPEDLQHDFIHVPRRENVRWLRRHL